MAQLSTTSRLREAPAAEAAARIAPRRKTADQRLRIFERLTMRLTVMDIAQAEQLRARRASQIIAELLARREIDPPAGFVQLQIAGLSEAMIGARTMIIQGNLQAMDRLIRLTSALDRYHGFAPAQIPAPPEPPPPCLVRRLTAKRTRPEMAPQRLEKIKSGPGNGMVSEAWNPQDVVHRRAADRARLRPRSRKNDEAKFSTPQSVEIARNRERISETSLPRISPRARRLVSGWPEAEPRGWPGQARP